VLQFGENFQPLILYIGRVSLNISNSYNIFLHKAYLSVARPVYIRHNDKIIN